MKFTDEQKQKALDLAKNLSNKFSKEDMEKFINKFKNLEFIDDVKLLFEMVMDKNYQLSKTTYLTIIGALAYVVLPLDIIPDFIPMVGFIDDAFVVTFTIKQLSDEIDDYKRFKNESSK